MNINVTSNLGRSAIGKLNLNQSIPIVVEKVAKFLENRAKRNINQRIYGQPPSDSYRRTGKAQRSIIAHKQSNISYKVLSDTRVAGARKNYTPFLNRNRRIRRFNTHFWDDAVKESQNEVQKIIKNVTKL